MRRALARGAIALVVLLSLAQLVRVDRTNPPVVSDVPAPPEVKAALRRACYDCHSNETAWPWYSQVAPISWLLAYDVGDGRKDLNFSTWQRYDEKRRQKKLKETAETVNEGEMPPWYYVLVHPDARLADADRQALFAWAAQAGGLSTGKNPSGGEALSESLRR
jgi:Haem-binding domain